MYKSAILCSFLCLLHQILGRVIDMTHVLDKDVPQWPANITTKYKMTVNYADYYNNDFWLTYNTVEFFEHIGTHIDAPWHFAQSAQRMHEIPIDNLYGPGAIIDVTHKAKANPKYGVTVQDILNYERQYGKIKFGSIVLMDSGYHTYFPNAKKIFGTETPNDTSTFNFPGWSIEACKFLMTERQISALGVDTPSADAADDFNLPCHLLLQPNNIVLIEYAANLGRVPRNGTHIFIGAIKTRNGSGGATRLMALVDDPEGKEISAAMPWSSCRWLSWTIASSIFTLQRMH